MHPPRTPNTRYPTPPLASSTLAIALAAALLLGGGCSSSTPNPEHTATDIAEETATQDYWWSQDNPVRVPAPDFDRAIDACQHAARERFFEIDRVDAREGLVQTKPSTSAQWFEPWRRDNTTAGDVARSSLDTYRRVVRFHIQRADTKNPAAGYTIVPQVLVERESLIGRRLTTVTGFRLFTATDQTTLSEVRDEGVAPNYWYSVGRDHPLEYQLAKAVINAMH